MYTIVAGIAALLTMATSAYPQSAGQPGHAPRFENLVHQAEVARDAKRLDEALTLYKRALELKPGWEDGWGKAGSIAYELEKYSECASDFRRLTVLKPDFVPAWTLEGLCEYQLRDYQAALKSLTQVQRLGFQENLELSRTARLHLALVLAKLGYSEKAIAWLFKLILIERNKTPEIVVALGIAGLRKRWIPPEVPESERDKVLKLGDAMATFMTGGDHKDAFGKFEAALRDYPKEPDFHYRFGAFLLEQDPDRGIEEIKKTLDLEPGHIPALVALARIYLGRGESQTALPYAERAVELSPVDITAHATLGQVLLATGDTAGAVRELELGVKLAPESPELHYNLGSAYGRMGRKADAVREREESKRLRKSMDSRRP
ncbi:MAG: tetratricopeptide repeat protein [Terriglobia bacterium]